MPDILRTQGGLAKPTAYAITAGGLVVALIAALTPMPTGAYWLSGGFLLLGAIPYFVYVSLSEIVECCSMLGAGFGLLAVDLTARLGFGIVYTPHASLMSAVYLCLVLVLVAIPAGMALGRLLPHRRA